MLNFLRKRASSWLIKVALFLIVIVFVLWGGYSYQERHRSHIVKVGDTYITWKEYARVYDELLEFHKRQLESDFSEEAIKRFDIKNQALNILIDRVVLLEEAKNLGIRPSQRELQEAIEAIPLFHVNGRFDINRYKLVLQQNRLTPEIFEHEMAQSLTLKKLEEFVTRQIRVSDEDIANYVRILRTEKQFLCARFPWEKYEPSIEIESEEALKNYYFVNQKGYEEPEKRKISYVFFRTSDFKNQVSVSNEELQAYYEDHKKEYRQEKAVRARHILFRVSPDAPQEEVEKVRKKAEEILTRAKKGEKFEDLAVKYSEDPGSASSGGDLGYFTEQMVEKELAETVFSMKIGQISDLIRTPYGFHIIKVEDVRPEKTLSFEEARESIREKLIEEKARDIAYSQAKEFADFANGLRDIAKASVEKKLNLVEVQKELSQRDIIPSIPDSAGIMKSIFNLEEKAISDALEVRDGFLVVQVQAIKPARVPDFEEVKESVKNDYKKAKSEELAFKEAERLLNEAKESGSLEKSAKQLNIALEKSPFLNRLRPDLNFGLWGEELESLMNLSTNVPLPEKPSKALNAYLVCQLADTKLPNEKTIKDEATRFKPMLMEQVTRFYWESWKKQLRKNAKIEMLQKI